MTIRPPGPDEPPLPGGYNSGAYATGWARILGRFAASVATDPAREEDTPDER
jgi:hypothetical protein